MLRIVVISSLFAAGCEVGEIAESPRTVMAGRGWQWSGSACVDP